VKPDQPHEDPNEDPILQVIGYHQQTKHHFFRYARALGYMDWANQPNPFRRYEGASLFQLPLLSLEEDPPSPLYDDLYRPGAVPSQAITLRTLSRFFEYALALSAWKEAGATRWALRSNPSSGNLHPTEGYLLIGGVPDLMPTPGLYHYAAKEHGLERRADFAAERFAALMKAFPSQAFLVAFSSIHWRESWKYGERAFRYCQHDVGHAIGAARIAATTLGWRMVLLEGVGDEEIPRLLGIDRDDDFGSAEREHPDCVAVVWPDSSDERASGERGTLPLGLDAKMVRTLTDTMWRGQANRLSRGKPDPWEIIDVVAEVSWKPSTELKRVDLPPTFPHTLQRKGSGVEESPLAGQIIHQRRSALAFDGKTSISANCFFGMLTRVMPRHERPLLGRPMPWDAIPWDPAIHLALFVHRVDGLQPGLYMLVRDLAKWSELRQIMHEHFQWAKPAGCPDDLPLFLLEEGDARRVAAQVSCHQEIAGDSAFSLGMIAEFESSLRRYGPWFYRRLFWETGVIGQVLYLEAEAAGVRATGIGCFFDDPVHQVFGFKDTTFQSLYHFTTGGHVDDPRLTTLPPYDFLR
jgi:SagB-type dehydrogenase family enzyme